MNVRNNRWIVMAVIVCLIAFASSLLTSIWGEYGGHNLRLAVARFVEAHHGQWPQSWDDLEPYHSDPVFGCHSTRFVQRYWAVAWDIDPMEVMTAAGESSDQEPVPVVYNKKRISDPSSIRHWDLGKRMTTYYQSQSNSAPEPSRSPDSSD